MEGPECPLCGKDSDNIIDTTNDWPFSCDPCNIRFKIVHPNAEGVFTFAHDDREIVFLDGEPKSAAVIYSVP